MISVSESGRWRAAGRGQQATFAYACSRHKQKGTSRSP